MTQLEFTNRIDGTIKDFTGGAIDDIEFRSHILDTLIELAQGRFLDDQVKEFDYSQVEQWFIPSERGNPRAEHFRLSGIEHWQYTKLNPERLFIDQKKVEQKLFDMGAEIAYHQVELETFPQKGFWLEPTEKFLNLLWWKFLSFYAPGLLNVKIGLSLHRIAKSSVMIAVM